MSRLVKKISSIEQRSAEKESKESNLWLRIIELEKTGNTEDDRSRLSNEAEELAKIFGSIIEKCK